MGDGENLLGKAAARLGIPLWGRLLVWGLVLCLAAIAVGFYQGIGHLNKIDSSIRVLASKQPPDVRDLIRDLLSQAKTEQDSSTDRKLRPIQKQLDGLGASVKSAEAERQDLKRSMDQRAAITRIDNPGRILAIIRGEIELASTSPNKMIPDAQIVGYKRAVLAIPQSTPTYWETVQTVIDYESFVLQVRGLVPDPAKVAGPCAGLTNDERMHSSHNLFIGAAVSSCIVDLDTQMFSNVVFRNSVIRSRGGTFVLDHVTFINCRFVLELPDDRPKRPNEQRFMMAIISAPAQQNVVATTG